MLPMAHLTSHSRMSGSRWVTTPSWLSRSLRYSLYSSTYSCHLFLFFTFNLFFNWRIIALQNFVVFCQTSTWISHKYTWSVPPPSWSLSLEDKAVPEVSASSDTGGTLRRQTTGPGSSMLGSARRFLWLSQLDHHFHSPHWTPRGPEKGCYK